MTRRLKARDIERLENTTLVSFLPVIPAGAEFIDGCGASECVVGGGCTGTDCNTCIGSCITDDVHVDTRDHLTLTVGTFQDVRVE